MADGKDYLGLAAIAVFESLVLSLRERETISQKEADNVLIDAIAALEAERGSNIAPATYGLAIEVIKRIQRGANGVR